MGRQGVRKERRLIINQLNQNKMEENIVTAVIIGFWLGYAIGWLIEKSIKKVDGKFEIDQYMKKFYGDKWINL
jgi:NhaP-type Na+/H+ or K+/H+ antiporter